MTLQQNGHGTIAVTCLWSKHIRLSYSVVQRTVRFDLESGGVAVVPVEDVGEDRGRVATLHSGCLTGR